MTAQGEHPGNGGSGRRRGFGRWPTIVVLVLGILAAGWTALWTTARGRVSDEVDRRIAGLAAAGVGFACGERVIGGFPFRFEISCRDPGLTLARQGVVASAAAVRVVAQAWDPFLVITELDGPFTLTDRVGSKIAATWRSLRFSLRWHMRGVDRLSLSGEGVDLTSTPVGGGELHYKSEHLEVHGRTSGAKGGDVELALTSAASTLWLGGKRVGPERSDVEAASTLVDFLPPGRGEPLRIFAERGGRIDPIRFGLAMGGLTFAGKGTLTLGTDGLLDGEIGVAARGLESLASGGARVLGGEATTLATGFVLLGKPSSDPDLPGRRLDLIVDHGRPRLGRVVFPPMAPLFAPEAVR